MEQRDSVLIARAPRVPFRFAPREVDVRYRADGAIEMRSPIPLEGCPRNICDFLEHWSREAPDRVFLAQRNADGNWRHLTYAQGWRRARAIGQALLDQGLGPARPLAILTGNSIEHALMSFGAMIAGVPVAPISPGYSIHAGGLPRLAEIVGMLQPALVFAQSADALAGARALGPLAAIPWVSVAPARNAIALAAFEQVGDCTQVDLAFAAANHDTIAKILFTSGSTGTPKGVPNSQGMMCSETRANQLVITLDAPPVTVDWMPWHHTFGGNSTLNAVLRDGGTLHIDDGLPLPGLFDKTIRNLREIACSMVQMAPAGLQMLVPALEADDALRERFFERLGRIGFGGASLPPDIFHRLQALAVRTTGQPVPIVSGYGSTETAPAISGTYWASEGKGELGLPVPGCTMKLVPFEDRHEVRVCGPNVFAGYLGRPDLSAQAFDEDGFYCTGDTVKWVDRADPSKGLLFAGRLSENFKLCNGSWVLTGELRLAVLAAASAIAEAVVAGPDRDDVRLLVWPAAGLHGAEANARIRDQLLAYNAATSGSTRRIAAFRILADPPSLAAGEITDKGNVNQRAVLANRRNWVDGLYDNGDGVVLCAPDPDA